MGIGPTDRINPATPPAPGTVRRVERDSDVRDDEEQRTGTPYDQQEQAEEDAEDAVADTVEVSEEYKQAVQLPESESDDPDKPDGEPEIRHIDIRA